MTIMNRPPTDEEKKAYYAKCDRVARSLYSLDHHFCRWEDARVEVQLKYRHKAHLARVWWGIEVNQIQNDSPVDGL